jgi:hypothetical protein
VAVHFLIYVKLTGNTLKMDKPHVGPRWKTDSCFVEYLFFLKQEARGYWLPKSGVIKENPSEEVV